MLARLEKPLHLQTQSRRQWLNWGSPSLQSLVKMSHDTGVVSMCDRTRVMRPAVVLTSTLQIRDMVLPLIERSAS
jgi:hypothetical protein